MALTKTKIAVGATAAFLLAAAATILLMLKSSAGRDLAGRETPPGRATIPAAPVDLTAIYTTPASYFDQITAFPAWKTVPRGEHVFDDVTFQIGGMLCLWGGGNAAAGLVFPEERLGIPMNQKFDTLYVFHGAFYVSPPGTPVYEIVFRYADDSSATNQILYGEDVLDWYAPRGKAVPGPTGPNSQLAWHSDNPAGAAIQPVRFCLTAVKNPRPLVEVRSIDLYSSKSRSAACILAFSTTKSKAAK